MLPTTLILDFDGTIALEDVGDALCERFALPEWVEIDEQWERDELSLYAAQRQMWALVRARPQAFRAAVEDLSALRPGFDSLLERACADGVRLVVASGGFSLYIEQILGPRLERFESVYANSMSIAGDRVGIDFPHMKTLGCDRCAVCKGRVCDHYRALGDRVVFVGDGSSDRCAVGRADRLYCVRGSKLASSCQAQGCAAIEIDSFDEVSW